MGLQEEGETMSDDTANVSMPEGIEVDEAAAYFGVFESSDALHQMMEMSRENAFEKFFTLLSDLVLQPGDFDFEIPGLRGGTHRTRYYGHLEGVKEETIKLAKIAINKKEVSMHSWLDNIIKKEALKIINKNEKA